MKTRIKNNYKALVKSIVDATPIGYEGNRIERELITLSWKDFVSEVGEEFDADPAAEALFEKVKKEVLSEEYDVLLRMHLFGMHIGFLYEPESVAYAGIEVGGRNIDIEIDWQAVSFRYRLEGSEEWVYPEFVIEILENANHLGMNKWEEWE